MNPVYCMMSSMTRFTTELSSKANAPTLHMREEDVRRHGCEAPSILSEIVTRMAVLSQYLCL